MIRRLREQRGSALVEFVFVALVVFLPLVYVVAGFSAVQRGVFASTEAAREAGRAIGTAPDAVTGQARAVRAAQLAVEDQSVDATDVRVRRVARALLGAGHQDVAQVRVDGHLQHRHEQRQDQHRHQHAVDDRAPPLALSRHS